MTDWDSRDHQRYAQERGADRSYLTQKCLKLYCQPFGWNGCLCFLRYKTSINMEFEMEGEAEVKQLTLF